VREGGNERTAISGPKIAARLLQADQRVWLEGSPHPVQVVLEGGHAIHGHNPAGVLAEIIKVLERGLN
jgi:hypothetical protein